jgi:hypothetical protein
MDEPWEEPKKRREDKDAKMQELRDMVAKLVKGREVDRVREKKKSQSKMRLLGCRRG